MIRNNTKKHIFITALIIAAVLIMTALPVISSLRVYAITGNPDSISDGADLIAFAHAFNAGDYDQDCVVEIATSSGTEIDLRDGFEGIGTSARPFKGTIRFSEGALDTFLVNRALFGCITPSVQIIDSNGSPKGIIIKRGETTDIAPLFADLVKYDSSNASDVDSWEVSYETYVDGVNSFAKPFAGLIGEIEHDCKVSITFSHSAEDTETHTVASVVGLTGAGAVHDAGTICCKLGANAELTVDFTSTVDYEVTSSAGNAGGLVGSMGSGSTLKLASAFTSKANVTSGTGYAGALVGSAVDAVFDRDGNTVTMSKTVSGSLASGGVFGYYSNVTGDKSFDLTGIGSDTDFTLSGANIDGGFIGKLESSGNDITISDSEAAGTYGKNIKFGGTSSIRGGVIGEYSNTSLAKTLDIHNVKVKISADASIAGGAIGNIGGSSAVYTKIKNFTCNTDTTTVAAGLIANMGDNGSFLDLYDSTSVGTVTVIGKCKSGLVDEMNAGVLRIYGTTDLSGVTSCGTAQLVGERGNGLVYALGDGNNAGWTFKRGSGNVDDIGDWGEVLRAYNNGSNKESTYFTVNNTAHTVTVKAPVLSMANIDDFILTALNIQLNDQNRGALQFPNTAANRSSNLLSSNLEITDDIDLSGTGIVALTRDNGGNAAYTGTFNGNGHTITLAIGENYGYNVSTTKGDNNYGTIFRHQYLGLFAKIGSGAEIDDLTVDGFISAAPSSIGNTTDPEYNIGGVTGAATGAFTLDTVITQQTIDNYQNHGNIALGGAIGRVASGATGTATITGCEFNSQIHERRRSAGSAYNGGAIGRVDAKGALTFAVSSTDLGGTYKNYNANGICYGGLIGYIVNTDSHNFTRNVNITDVTVTNTAKIESKLSSKTSSGSFLGGSWLDTNVTIGTTSSNGLTIGESAAGDGPSITVTNSKSNVAALVCAATGYWQVNNVKVVKGSADSVSDSSFGFMVNDATNVGSALYLELIGLSGSGKAYDIGAFTCAENKFSVYDELVANTRDDNGGTNSNRIEDNGNAVVSIKTTGTGVIMTGSNCNTYQNQTSVASYKTKVNSNTRYYYNLDTIRDKETKSAGEKLLLWSLDKYAHSTIKSYFTDGFTDTFSGNMDMEGLSYYPVNASGVTINSGSTIKFYNKEIETGESGTGNSDSTARSTRSGTKSQHYLMHESIFLDYTGDLTVNGLTVAGNVSNSGGESGFIVRRKYGGTDVTSEAALKNIVLAGAKIEGRSSKDYAPLLINKVGKNVKLSFDDVSVCTDSSQDNYYTPSNSLIVASSLVGDVGDDTATNINLSFSKMQLDARTMAASSGDLTSAYGTYRSLFDRATFLNEFRFASGGIGIYNYNYAEDYGTKPHYVTYAKEISHTKEFKENNVSKQRNYYDHFLDSNYYTNPTGTVSSAYDFSTNKYLPHVYTAYDTTNNTHEIMVNIKQVDLTDGCGQYNHPYKIDNGGIFVTAAKIISGTPDPNIQVCLPTDVGTDELDMWCENDTADAVYKYDGTVFVNTAEGQSSDTKSLAVVREYLAGAYYQLTDDVAIPSGVTFVGLGAVGDGSPTDFENRYAFRGVIVSESGEYHTITNNSSKPLVQTANGCVLKNINIDVKGTITLSLAKNNLKFSYYSGGSAFYGGAIGQVLGGDNIIDNVQINFDNATFTEGNTAYRKLIPIGGYVGVIVNGGVIFRNMSGDIDGLPAFVWSHVAESDKAWLYSNPIIGRVLSGYAFTESTTPYVDYVVDGVYDYNSVTMKNGRNNYSIPDIYVNTSNKITVTASSNSDHEITVPDGQSLYLLGCIVNSGAGSAGYHDNTEQVYQDLAGTPWSAYRNYTCSRCAAYSDVGDNNAANGNSCDDYKIVAAMDKYSGAAKVPYIIYKYTNKDGSVYHARSICNGAEPSVTQINFASGDFYLPASFRGLGSLYWDSPYLRLQFKRLDGKNAKLIYSTYFLDYDMQGTKGINLDDYNDDTKNYKTHDNYINMHHVGLGLFSQFYQVKPGSTDYIKNFSVSGKIFYDIVKYSDGSPIAYNWTQNKDSQDSENSIYYYSVLNVGGVIGSVYGAKNQDDANNVTNTSTGSRKNQKESQFKIKNVTIDGAEFEGAKSVGGLIGYVSHSREDNNSGLINREIVECGSTALGVKLIAGVNAGGLIGYLNRNVTITGAEGKTDLYIDSIRIKGVNTTGGNSGKAYFDYISGDKIFCAGGLVGFADMKYGDTKVPTFSNYKIIGVGNKVNVYSENTSPETHIYVGGVVGELKSASLKIQNVEISGLNLKATYSGGVLAAFFHDKSTTEKLTLTLENVTVDGGSGRSYIEGLRTAGGLLARNESTSTSSGVSYNNIESCVIKDYDIISSAPDCGKTSTYNSNWYLQAVGAVAGTSLTNNANGNTFNIHDLKVESCVLSANWSVLSTASYADTVGAGGLFGMINKAFIKGSDILLDGTTVNYHKNGAAAASNDDPRVAGLIGNNRDGGSASSYIKLVAVSVQDLNSDEGETPPTRLAGKVDTTGEVNFGTGGYVILADLRGAATETDPNTLRATPATGSSEMTPKSPYVQVNPIFNIGNSGYKLTGDGIAATVNGLPVRTVLNGGEGDWRYAYANSNIGTFIPYYGKLSTFNAEQGTNLANDFAVLVVDDTKRVNVTDMINSYISLIANDSRTPSDHNGGYANNVSNVYSVDIINMTWNGTAFVAGGTPNLKKTTTNPYQFYMDATSVDTDGSNTFSLIDVKYYDPVNTTKIAYHLYIPVIVRKMLFFDFEIATGSGTNYQRSWYADNDRFGAALMENMGSPVSVYFKYNYIRSKSEWETAINGGENVLRNFDKKLSFDISNKLDSNTILVLVDPNNGGKAYYASYSQVFGNGTSGTFSLSSFYDDFNGTLGLGTGNSFRCVDLCDLLDLSYVLDNTDGTLVFDTSEDHASATVKANGASGEKYLRPATSGDTGDKYKIVVNNSNTSYSYESGSSVDIVQLDESYYISFFTPKVDSSTIHRYILSSAGTFGDSSNPTRLVSSSLRNSTNNVYLFMGNIFVQSNFSVSADTANELMDAVSRTAELDVNMSSTVSIAPDVYSGIRAYLNAKSEGEYRIKVYQSFILNLTRYESAGHGQKLFIDDADPSATVKINDTLLTSPVTVYPSGSYAEVRYDKPLNEYLLVENNSPTPVNIETDIHIEYDEDRKVQKQFPTRNDVTDDDIGTKVSGSSNVAYDPSRTAYSKSIMTGNDVNDRSYYCLNDENKAHLKYNVDIDYYKGEYDPLGINPLDNRDTQNAYSITTRATYDINDIFDKTVDYDMIRCKVKLYCKHESGAVAPYTTALDFTEYMDTAAGIYLSGGLSGSKSFEDDNETLVFTMTKAAVEAISSDATHKILEIPITYTIYTGKSDGEQSTFESQHHVYSNYKLYIEVELYKDADSDVLTSSKANDYLIYTNARIITDYVDELTSE